MSKTEINLEEPVIIAQAGPELRSWGPYQFPFIERLPDGRLHCIYHLGNDTASDYGVDTGNAVSEDDGKTWCPSDMATKAGLLLPNGDRLMLPNKKAIPRSALEPFPKRLSETLINSYKGWLYDPDDLPREFNGWYLDRKPAGSGEWVEERHEIHIPFEARIYFPEPDCCMPYPVFSRLRLAPDGMLWGLIYNFTWRDGVDSMAAIFVTSDDNGHHWDYRSSIYYKPDREDRYWALRTGYTEPDIAFLPDGSLMCLMRTDDSFNRGPSYCCYSTDGGFTWTDPVRFDDFGVWPCFLTLKNGSTILGYGRPGLFLRASTDAAGKEWSDRVTIVPAVIDDPEKHLWGEQDTTCSYCDMMAIGDDSLYLVYSDFMVPNEAGHPCKTILGRKVTVRNVQ